MIRPVQFILLLPLILVVLDGAAELHRSTDYAMSRIRAMDCTIAPLNIADFEYVGMGRRAATELAGGMILKTFAAAGPHGWARTLWRCRSPTGWREAMTVTVSIMV